MKKKDVVIIGGRIIDVNKEHADVAIGKKSTGIQILRIKKQVFPYLQIVERK
jgi:hypothetical protein